VSPRVVARHGLDLLFKNFGISRSSARVRRSFRGNFDYYPLDYCRLRRNIDLLKARETTTPKNRHIQPPQGPARAFGDALREMRREKGISQERLALDSGLDRTYISLVERGAQSPTMRTVVKIAGVLEVKPSDIVLRMEALTRKPRVTKRR
jgi:DNA-binding XRE family transcriptional regulator